MKTKDPLAKHRRKGLPFALGGLIIGAGLAYVLVRWHRAVTPSVRLKGGQESPSIYAVSGDLTGDWPAPVDTAAGSAAARRKAAAADAGGTPLNPEVAEDPSAAWGDVPAVAMMIGGEPAQAEGMEAANLSGAATAGSAVVDGPSEAAEILEGSDEQPAAESGRARRSSLEEIEGIGAAYAKLLGEVGLSTTSDLLEAGADPKGREGLAEATGISKKLILRWVNEADLFRIKGVGEQYADLLEAAGVDTVPELAQRRADNLTRRMVEVNDEKGLVRRTPTEAQVAGWIEEAKGLPRVVTY